MGRLNDLQVESHPAKCSDTEFSLSRILLGGMRSPCGIRAHCSSDPSCCCSQSSSGIRSRLVRVKSSQIKLSSDRIENANRTNQQTIDVKSIQYSVPQHPSASPAHASPAQLEQLWESNGHRHQSNCLAAFEIQTFKYDVMLPSQSKEHNPHPPPPFQSKQNPRSRSTQDGQIDGQSELQRGSQTPKDR